MPKAASSASAVPLRTWWDVAPASVAGLTGEAPPVEFDDPDRRIDWHLTTPTTWAGRSGDLALEVRSRDHTLRTGVVRTFTTIVRNEGAAPASLDGLRQFAVKFTVPEAVLPRVRHMTGSYWYDACYPPRAFRLHEEAFMTHDTSVPVVIGGANAGVHSPVLQVALDRNGSIAGFFVGFGWSGGWSLAAGYDKLASRSDPRPLFEVVGEIALGSVSVDPGGSVTLPDVHLGFFETSNWGAVDDLQREFVRSALMPTLDGKRVYGPVAYNSWFGTGDDFDLDYLLRQATRAAELGCEYFCLDAAWYASRENFMEGIGNWRTPDPVRLGADGVALLSSHVRTLGMGFGLWLLPQIARPGTDAIRERPDLYRATEAEANLREYERKFGTLKPMNPGLPRLAQGSRLALEREEAVAYAADLIGELVDRWSVSWIRFESVPEDGLAYNQGYDRLLGRLLTRFPHLYVEACNGGGQRLDLGMVTQSHGNWLSDHTTDPHVVRFMQTGALRWWPPALLNMAVVSFKGENATGPTALDLLSRMTGTLSFSGDIAAWSQDGVGRARAHVDLVKRLREFQDQPVSFPLPQPRTLDDWDVVVFGAEDTNLQIVYAFRVRGPADVHVAIPRGHGTWQLMSGPAAAGLTEDRDGVTIRLPPDSAGLWVRAADLIDVDPPLSGRIDPSARVLG